MNNFEKIKNMTVDEMANYFDDIVFVANISRSLDGIKNWLNSEVEE